MISSDFDSLSRKIWSASLQELTLAPLLIRALKRRGGRPVVVDSFLGDKTLSGFEMLTMALLFSNWLRTHTPERRVGIVLPTGLAAAIVNLGVVLAGKVPVNLNFTAGRLSNQSCIRKAELKSIITVGPMVEKLPDFPWTENRYDAKSILQGFSKAEKILTALSVIILPVSWIEKFLQIPKSLPESEAALLFTSGSSGEPKGVVLTHRNLLSNVLQIEASLGELKFDCLLASLPTFHSFGFTVTLWWPLLGGPRMVTYPSPTETKVLAEVIERHQIALLLSTPTFLRSFLRRATREQLKSLKMVVTGAEKLPLSVLQGFEEKFGVPVCEGYGMTEATPAVAFNRIEADGRSGKRRKIGTVGRVLTGIQVQIRDPHTDDVLPSGSGMIWLKGPNIFPGYLNDPERSSQVLKDQWYKTGDLGSMTDDGFLVVEGRLSRFSKIAGEMVPHGVVEERIQHALGLADSDQLEVAVAGVEDERKGEALLLLTTKEVEMEGLRQKLLEAGLPALWIPKKSLKVDLIPTLASGKLDLKRLREIVAEQG